MGVMSVLDFFALAGAGTGAAETGCVFVMSLSVCSLSGIVPVSSAMEL